ncbi:hypothetical protein ACFE04_021231 [Oxalis oulophora]
MSWVSVWDMDFILGGLLFSQISFVDIDYISKSDWVKPRRGEKYQAEIPSLVSKSEILKDSATLIWTGVAAEKNKYVSSWNETDVDAFVLGLYTFSKNFLHIKNFLVSMSFEGRRISLLQYLACLKEIVGKKNLVETVEIGKAKHIEKNNQVFRFMPPNGKDFSLLTLSEITKYLSGSFRLNNAWGEDIFWGAVWPRLSARGWNFERPINQGYVAHAMVFLVPGIKKFSRKGLMKRIQYFDTISDILDKVVSEPKLIELENDENKEDICGEENDKVREELLEGNLPSDSNAVDNYIPSDNRNSKEMQFTVGSTSDTNGKALESNSPRKFGEEHQDQDQLQDGQCLKSCESEEDNVPLVKKRKLTSFDHENFLDDEKLEEDGQWYDIHSHLGTETKISVICIDLTDVGLNSAKTNEKVEEDYQWYNIHSHLGIEIKISEICIDLTNDVLDSASRGPSVDSQSVNSSNPSISADFNVLEQPARMKRRKGMRNRPMSTKALEALQTSLNHKEDKSRKPLHTIQDNSLRNHR